MRKITITRFLPDVNDYVFCNGNYGTIVLIPRPEIETDGSIYGIKISGVDEILYALRHEFSLLRSNPINDELIFDDSNLKD